MGHYPFRVMIQLQPRCPSRSYDMNMIRYTSYKLNYLDLTHFGGAYRPTSQPFSACNCRRGNYLLGNPSEIICFLAFCDEIFYFSPPFFFRSVVLSFFQLRVLLAVRFLFCIQKKSFSSFPFLSFFFFRFFVHYK